MKTIFTTKEMKRFVSDTYDADVMAAVKWDSELDDVAFELVEALARYGHLTDQRLFNALTEKRGQWRDTITAVRDKLIADRATETTDATDKPPLTTDKPQLNAPAGDTGVVMNAAVTHEIKHAIVVDKAHLERVHQLLQHEVGAVRWLVRCTDEVLEQMPSINHVTAHPNVDDRQIQALTMKASSESKPDGDYGIGCELVYILGATVEFSIEGPAEHLRSLRRKLVDELRATRPWYSTIAVMSQMKLVFFLALIPTGIAAAGKGKDMPDTFITAFFLSFLSLVFLLRPLRKLFPCSVFALGAGLGRHQLLEKFRWLVVITIPVLTAIGIALRLLA